MHDPYELTSDELSRSLKTALIGHSTFNYDALVSTFSVDVVAGISYTTLFQNKSQNIKQLQRSFQEKCWQLRYVWHKFRGISLALCITTLTIRGIFCHQTRTSYGPNKWIQFFLIKTESQNVGKHLVILSVGKRQLKSTCFYRNSLHK